MSQFGGGGGGGTEFHLPDEILAVMPRDPYEQLDLARKITSMALSSRVSTLETDVGHMRQKLYEKDRSVYELQEKVSHLQRAYQEADSRLKITLDDNLKLTKERDLLTMTVKKLNRDLSKLETFKRQLLQSLNNDDSSQAETVDIGTSDQSVPQSYPEKAPMHGGQRFSLTPFITPRLTPTGTPKAISTSGSTSPTKTQYEGRTSLSSWYPSSQQSSAANSPPRGRSVPVRPPRIDGKEFFRLARIRLSYEQFSAFLANIKELNAQKQTREETLRKAEEIFGVENKDLYLSFQGLLNRNTH